MQTLMANPNTPGSGFHIGNIDTLKNYPEQLNVNVQQELVSFYKTHYSANLMNAVISGKESIK
jgi:insulysin